MNQGNYNSRRQSNNSFSYQRPTKNKRFNEQQNSNNQQRNFNRKQPYNKSNNFTNSQNKRNSFRNHNWQDQNQQNQHNQTKPNFFWNSSSSSSAWNDTTIKIESSNKSLYNPSCFIPNIFSQDQISQYSAIPQNWAQGITSQNQKLPIYLARQNILQTIFRHQVTIISGQTGCGKTTQVPSYIYLSSLQKSNPPTKIICTQPRRLACINLSKRVSKDLGPVHGKNVGYQISLQNTSHPNTRILFLTTGILLNKLISKKTDELQSITHIVLDQVHQRDCTADFTMTVIKSILKSHSKIKLILMSATFSTQLFARYFSPKEIQQFDNSGYDYNQQEIQIKLQEQQYEQKRWQSYGNNKDNQNTSQWKRNSMVNSIWGSSSNNKQKMHTKYFQNSDEKFQNIIEINHRSFEVHKMYWEHMLAYLQGVIDPHQYIGINNSNNRHPILYSQTTQLCITFIVKRIHIDRIFSNFQANGVYKGWKPIKKQKISSPDYLNDQTFPPYQSLIAKEEQKVPVHEPKTILIFLPGMNQINNFIQVLNRELVKYNLQDEFQIYPLHSSQPTIEQQAIFSPVIGKRKVIVATNIAESSITIPDVRFVFDFMLCKENHFDVNSKSERLQLEYICKANSNQRAGRAGRVAEGLCFRMMTESKFLHLPQHPQPEIRRCSLDRVCLMVKSLNIMEPRDLLSKTIQPPSIRNIDSALTYLCDNGALTTPFEHYKSGMLTKIGEIYLKIPCDLRFTRLFLFGLAFNLLHECIIIGAIHSQTRSIFYVPRGKSFQDQLMTKLYFDQGDESDSIMQLRVYLEWKKRQKRLRKNNLEQKSWCYNNCLDLNTLWDIFFLQIEISKRFNQLSVPTNLTNKKCFEQDDSLSPEEKKQKLELLKFVIAFGFFRNFLKGDYRYVQQFCRKKEGKVNEIFFNQLPAFYTKQDI